MKNKILVLFLLVVMILPMFNFVKADTTLKSKYAIDDLKEYFKANKTFDVVNLASKEREKINLPENINFDTLFKDTYVNFHDYFILYNKKTNTINILFNNVSDNTSFDYKIGDYFYFNDLHIGYFYDNISLNLNNKQYLYFKNTSPISWSFSDKSDYYICSNTNFYCSSDGNYDLWYSPDDTIGDSSSDLQLSYKYNEDTTSCHIDATLKGGEFTDQIFYSNIAPSIAGQGLLTKKPFPKAGIDITENQALYFQAEDKDGNIKATNSISINKIGKLTPDCFNVTFNFSKGTGTFSWVEVIPNLTLHQSPYYDIYYKIKTDNILDLTSSTGNLVTEYNRIDNNKKMVFNTITGAKFTIYFEIRNKDGSIALTKTYDINLKAANVGQSGITGENENSGGSGISGGTVNGENDPNITNNDDYISNYEKMSLTELIETAKESFNTFRLAFSILPGYIWGSILILLGVVIALRILGR